MIRKCPKPFQPGALWVQARKVSRHGACKSLLEGINYDYDTEYTPRH